MKNLRLFFTCAACKIIHYVLRLLGRGGTALPGSVALRLYPGIIEELSKGLVCIVVSGTNGKTTTSSMIRNMLPEQERSCISNRSGANMTNGIAASFILETDFFGRRKKEKKYAVVECDEAFLFDISRALRPEIILVANIFRDQLDRYGEVSHIRDLLRKGIKAAPEATVCLNGDCPLTATLGEEIPNKVLYFGVSTDLASGREKSSDVPRCLRCGGMYEYRKRTFSHLGDWYCPACGARRPLPDVSVTAAFPDKEGTDISFLCGDIEFDARVSVPGTYNIYNAVSALSVLYALGADPSKTAERLGECRPPFGRMEEFELNGNAIKLMLAKNPEGMDRILEYLSMEKDPAMFVFALNDNYNDGTDISWIWDADFEGFASESNKDNRYFTFGTRKRDMLLRLKYAGLDTEKIKLLDGENDLTVALSESETKVYIAANYTSMLNIWDILNTTKGRGDRTKEKWN
ncbi:MAG: DUF1727 domain-containing protein [Oscillospiraceae bacterium]|nr:DUF1727 domain-containing protein [Oscillospiraceae bacterium]